MGNRKLARAIETVEAAGYAVVSRETAWRLSPWQEGQCAGIKPDGSMCGNFGGRMVKGRGLYCHPHRKQAWRSP